MKQACVGELWWPRAGCWRQSGLKRLSTWDDSGGSSEWSFLPFQDEETLKHKHILRQFCLSAFLEMRQCVKKQRHCFADKGPDSQSYGFSSCHVQM